MNTITKRPGAFPEPTTQERGPKAGHKERGTGAGAPSPPGMARGRRILQSVSTVWALAVLAVGLLGGAFWLGWGSGYMAAAYKLGVWG